jgi:hypothetical protein
MGFNLNWYDLDEVKTYARSLGKGMTVFKVPGRGNYNITHTERIHLPIYKAATIYLIT